MDNLEVPKYTLLDRLKVWWHDLTWRPNRDDEYLEELMAKAKAKDPIFTCHGCPEEPRCQWAWDLYNTNGDCLAEK